MKRYYFDKKVDEKHFELKKRYSNLSDDELKQNTNYKDKIYNVKKEENRFNKAFSEIYLDKQKTKKFVDTDIRELNEDIVEKIINTKLHSMSQKSIFNLVALVRAIVNYNIKKRKLDCKNIFANLDINFKNVQRSRERFLTKEEIVFLLLECKNYTSNPNVYNAVYLAVLTAGRKMTVLNIQKKDFDFQNQILSLYNYKTEKYYKVFLPKEAVIYFQNFLRDYDEDEYVIKNLKSKSKGNQPFRALPKKIYEIMDESFNKGIDKQDNDKRDKVVNFHTIRRSIATNMALDNVSIYKIMRLLNHSNIKQTQDYINLSDLNMSEEIENTHTNMYEYISLEREDIQASKSVEEYRQYLKDDHFSSSSDLYDFENQISSWRFLLESEYIDGIELEDFKTIADLRHYLKHRNQYATLEKYQQYKKSDEESRDFNSIPDFAIGDATLKEMIIESENFF